MRATVRKISHLRHNGHRLKSRAPAIAKLNRRLLGMAGAITLLSGLLIWRQFKNK